MKTPYESIDRIVSLCEEVEPWLGSSKFGEAERNDINMIRKWLAHRAKRSLDKAVTSICGVCAIPLTGKRNICSRCKERP